MPAPEPVDDALTRRLRLFVRALAHEWEIDAKPTKIQTRPGERLPHVLRAYGWIMKWARNWLAHGAALDQLTPAFVAYLFMVNMRAMFALPAEAQRYEHQLCSLWGTAGAALAETPLRRALAQSFATLKQQNLAAQ